MPDLSKTSGTSPPPMLARRSAGPANERGSTFDFKNLDLARPRSARPRTDAFAHMLWAETARAVNGTYVEPGKIGEFPTHLFKQDPVRGAHGGPQDRLVFPEGRVRRLPRTRYTLTRELIAGYSQEQVFAQEQRLKATGRWIIPSSWRSAPEGEFTLRIEGATGNDDDEEPEQPDREPPPGMEYLLADRVRHFMELDVIHVTDPDGSVHPEYKAFSTSRRHYPGLTPQLKLAILADEVNKGICWWEKGDWYVNMQHRHLDPDELHLSSHFYAMLVISLLDRVVNKVETTSRRLKSKKLTRAGLNNSQPDEDGIQRITLYCPGHFSRSDGEHAGTGTPKRMHYRAEHVKMQAHGPRYSLRKQITVAAVWVNAEDVDPSELGTPIRHIKLVGA
jgi:hypothetical protein